MKPEVYMLHHWKKRESVALGIVVAPVEQGLAIGPAGWRAVGAEHSIHWDAPASSLWLEEGPVWYKGLFGTRFRCPGKCSLSRVPLGHLPGSEFNFWHQKAITNKHNTTVPL